MSARARHVDATHPERVRVMMATGRIKGDEATIRTLCMVCGVVMAHGPTVDGMSSHGLCDHPDCTRLVTEPVDRRTLAHLTDRSERLWGRHYHSGESKGEWKRARRRVLTAIRFACGGKNGPDRDASQRVGSDRSRPSGDDTSKVADAPDAGNSGRNERYVIEVGSPGGTVARYRYPDFDAMLADVERVAAEHCGHARALAFGNEDRADVDDDGLTDAELERLEEVLHG